MGNNNAIIKILKGIICSFVVTLVTLFMVSIIMTYTNITESVVPILIIILTFISILIGTVISMRKTNKNGMINGAIIGSTYTILMYLISSILNTGFTMNTYTIVMLIGGIIFGIVGGIIAVNT